MNRLGILSIKPEFAYRILDGTKTIELRRSRMGVNKGDVLLLYISAPDQCLGAWFRVAKVEVSNLNDMWGSNHSFLGLDHTEYLKYFDGVSDAIGLHIGKIHHLKPVIFLSEIKNLVDGFVPPQGIIWIKSKTGRYANLIRKLNSQLPRDVLPQMSLFSDVDSFMTSIES
ncbi:MAG: ASCH domain-containing protein [Desulfobacteraceae bacterium]|nr:ASCH domain-containing protein [Desulfobacteraceae bacterium]